LTPGAHFPLKKDKKIKKTKNEQFVSISKREKKTIRKEKKTVRWQQFVSISYNWLQASYGMFHSLGSLLLFRATS
jgi:hypothetical protein